MMKTDSWSTLTFRSQEEEGSAIEMERRVKREVLFFLMVHNHMHNFTLTKIIWKRGEIDDAEEISKKFKDKVPE